MRDSRRLAVLTASSAMAMVLGSIHAFSIFVTEWEQWEGTDRESVSLVYSLALVSLTLAVLLGYRVFEKLSATTLFVVVGLGASSGLILSANSTTLVMLYVAYGLVFGSANGLGYGYALQLSGQNAGENRGFAMCLITACYAMGATLSPPIFLFLIKIGGNSLALIVMGVIILSVACLSAYLVFWSGARYQSEPATSVEALSAILKRTRLLMWIAYGSSVMAGLMIIGHAYGLARWMGFTADSATLAPMLVAFGNMLGGFSTVYLSDRFPGRIFLLGLPLCTLSGLLFLSLPLNSMAIMGLIGLGIVGYCYGALIAIYPVVIAEVFGALSAPRIYGQIFTAWGIAGLFGPWVSGRLFDQSDSYLIALGIAALFSVISVVAARFCAPASSPCDLH